MINRILLVLKTQNLSSSQFADEIGVQRSSISHILSGRNNPSLEFVTKILKRYPDINSEWILFGKGSMYKESIGKPEQNRNIKNISMQPDLFNFDEPEQVEMQPIKTDELHEDIKYENLNKEKNAKFEDIIPEIQLIKEEISPEKIETKTEQKQKIEEKPKEIKTSQKTIEKIVIFYSDKTFREYFPE